MNSGACQRLPCLTSSWRACRWSILLLWHLRRRYVAKPSRVAKPLSGVEWEGSRVCGRVESKTLCLTSSNLLFRACPSSTHVYPSACVPRSRVLSSRRLTQFPGAWTQRCPSLLPKHANTNARNAHTHTQTQTPVLLYILNGEVFVVPEPSPHAIVIISACLCLLSCLDS